MYTFWEVRAMVFTEETKRQIDKLYQGRKHVELTCGILREGQKEIIHWDPARQESPDTLIYPVGSICKPFTASLLAKYAAEGKLRLDAPISEYIPDLPPRYYPSLVKLATHTSGFKMQPYTLLTSLPFFLKMNREGVLFHTNPFRGKLDEAGMLQIIRDTVLRDKPYPFVYSNIGMSILGYIVGQVSGEGFWDGLTRYIREELGLQNTFLGNVELTGYDRRDQPCRCWLSRPGTWTAPCPIWPCAMRSTAPAKRTPTAAWPGGWKKTRPSAGTPAPPGPSAPGWA